MEEVPGALVTAQKILSCVARVKESFGIGHVVSVLRGEASENVRRWRHDQLTTFGLLKGESKVDVRDWVYQLLGQKVLLQVGAEYPLLHLNEASWEVMRGQRSVRLVRLVRRKRGEGPEKSAAAEVSWEGVDATAVRGAARTAAADRPGARDRSRTWSSTTRYCGSWRGYGRPPRSECVTFPALAMSNCVILRIAFSRSSPTVAASAACRWT